jgi:hypothetical protein
MALSTIRYNHKNFPIPSNKIFEKSLNLNLPLTGQTIKIKSIFTNEKSASMVIFYNEDDEMYRFKDFSSGIYGDALDVVMHIEKINDRQQGYRRVLEIFKGDEKVSIKDASGNITKATIVKEVKRVTKYTTRKWNVIDEAYFKEYGIGAKFLKRYNIKPISSYVFAIKRDSFYEEVVFTPAQCYGFFTKNGKLYKIYNPNNKKAKFIMIINNIIQGEEQLTFKKKALIIQSSLKDIGAFQSLGFNSFDSLAPESEGIIIPEEKLLYYKANYEYVFTMLDNDLAGMRSMLLYEEKFHIPYINFRIEKDMADARKEHGKDNCIIFFKEAFKPAVKKHHTLNPF